MRWSPGTAVAAAAAVAAVAAVTAEPGDADAAAKKERILEVILLLVGTDKRVSNFAAYSVEENVRMSANNTILQSDSSHI